jgi:hypothetical protein
MPTNLPVPPPADPLLPPRPAPKPDIVPPDDPNHDRTDREPNIDPPPTDPGVAEPGRPDNDRRLARWRVWVGPRRASSVWAVEVHP